MNALFKESFTEYNQGSENTLSGPQEAFAASLLEGVDASRNVYNTYNSYYRISGDRAELERRELERRQRLFGDPGAPALRDRPLLVVDDLKIN